MATGMFSLIIGRAERGVYLRFTDSCQISAPQTHTCAIPYATVTERRHVTIKYTHCRVHCSRKKPLGHKTIMSDSTIQCLSDSMFEWNAQEEQMSGMFGLNVNGRDGEALSRRHIREPNEEEFRSLSYRGPARPGRAVLFCIETTLGPQRPDRTKEPAFSGLFLGAEIMKVYLCCA